MATSLNTVADVKTAIRAHGFETDSDAQQLVFMNQVMRDLDAQERWSFRLRTTTVAVVPGTASYALAPTPALVSLESIRFATPSLLSPPEMEWMDAEELLERATTYNDTYDSTVPLYWSDVAPDTVQLWPIPQVAGTLTVRYFTGAAVMDADADEPDLPGAYRDILVYGTIAYLVGSRERQGDTYTRFSGYLAALTDAMLKRYGVRQRQTSPRVKESGDRYYPNANETRNGTFGWGY